MRLLDNTRITIKLFIAPGLILLLLCIMSMIVLRAFDKNSEAMTRFGNVEFQRQLIAGGLTEQAALAQGNLYHLLALLSNSADTEAALKLNKESAANIEAMASLLDQMEKLPFGQDQKAEIDSARQILKSYSLEAKQVADMALIDLATATLLMSKVIDQFDKLSGSVDRLEQASRDGATRVFMATEKAIAQSRLTFLALTAAAFVLGLALTFFLARKIAGSVVGLTLAMTDLAAGNREIDISGTERRDEIGGMARALNVFRDNANRNAQLTAEAALQQAEREKRREKLENLIQDFDTNVAGALRQVADAIQMMQDNARHIAEATEQSQDLSDEVAHSSKATSGEVGTVASAAEELTSSISEVGSQVVRSAKITDQAAKEALAVNEKVEQLAQASERIGEILRFIDHIAHQTNLLALNATIEAARAGDMGRGFAIVASEVKNLATQASSATQQINDQIGNIQHITHGVVDTIRHFRTVIEEVNGLAKDAATSVEQQGSATSEIAQSMSRAADATEKVSEGIANVTNISLKARKAAMEVLQATRNTASYTENLSQQVETFLRKVRSA